MSSSEIKKILIIGGNGFIGSHLANYYESKGDVVHKTTRYFDIENTEKKNISIDYSKESFLEIFSSQNYDLIFSLSGNPYPAYSENNPQYDIEHTVIPSLNLLQALKETKFKGSLWYGSSVAVYGDTNLKIQSESDQCNPLSSYALAKLTMEGYMKIYSSNYNLNCGSFRIFSTFGEGLRRQIVYDIFQKSMNDSEIIELLGSGSEARDISYVGDQVMRISIISENIIPKGDIYNIGSGTSFTTKQIAEKVIESLNLNKKIVFEDPLRKFDGHQWTASIKKFESVAKNPESNFEDVLRRTLLSFK